MEDQINDTDVQLGLAIEQELDALMATEKSQFSIDEIETQAPKTFDVLYDCCEEDDDENGIETSKYKLIEIESDEDDVIFKLSKK